MAGCLGWCRRWWDWRCRKVLSRDCIGIVWRLGHFDRIAGLACGRRWLASSSCVAVCLLVGRLVRVPGGCWWAVHGLVWLGPGYILVLEVGGGWPCRQEVYYRHRVAGRVGDDFLHGSVHSCGGDVQGYQQGVGGWNVQAALQKVVDLCVVLQAVWAGCRG